MAFNLNKNDGPEGTSASNSKFDLSKNVTSAPAVDGNSNRSSVLTYVVIGLLLVAGAAWYLLSNRSSPTEKNDDVSSTLNTVDSSSAVGKSPTVTNEAEKLIDDESKKVISQESEKAVNKIPVRFGRGTVSFSGLDHSIVHDIVAHLASNPSAKLEVLGYASSEGSVAINQTISQARADAFKNYLIAKDVTADRISAIGKGIEDPIASNDTESGRQKNRRVEVRWN